MLGNRFYSGSNSVCVAAQGVPKVLPLHEIGYRILYFLGLPNVPGPEIISYGFSIVPDFHLSTRTAHMILRLSWLLSRPLLGACLLCVLRCATKYLLPTVSNQDYITVKEAFFNILGICIAQLQPSTIK